MIAHPAMLVGPAKKAFIPVPENYDDYDSDEFPHWNLFCLMQLGQPMPSWTAHHHNAHIIARISDEEILTISPKQVMKRGFLVGMRKPA